MTAVDKAGHVHLKLCTADHRDVSRQSIINWLAASFVCVTTVIVKPPLMTWHTSEYRVQDLPYMLRMKSAASYEACESGNSNHALSLDTPLSSLHRILAPNAKPRRAILYYPSTNLEIDMDVFQARCPHRLKRPAHIEANFQVSPESRALISFKRTYLGLARHCQPFCSLWQLVRQLRCKTCQEPLDYLRR